MKTFLTLAILVAVLVMVAGNICLTLTLPMWACVPFWALNAWAGFSLGEALESVWTAKV